MRNVFLIVLVLTVFLLGMSFVSAKEDAHFEIDKDSSGYSAVITLKDSSNNPIPKVKFSISITKPNGAVRTYYVTIKKNLSGIDATVVNAGYTVNNAYISNQMIFCNETHIFLIILIHSANSPIMEICAPYEWPRMFVF